MALLVNTAETGESSGTAITTGNSAAPDAWSSVVTTAGGWTYSDTAQKGSLSAAVTFTGAGATYLLWSATGARTGVFRFYYRKTANPSTSGVGLITLGSSGTAKYANLVMNTSGAIALYDYAGGYYGNGTGAFTTATMSNNTWYRIEIALDNSGGSAAGTAVVKVYAGDSTTEAISFSTTGLNYGTANIAKVYLGRNFGTTDTGTPTFRYDDIAWQDGTTTLLGPSVLTGYGVVAGVGTVTAAGSAGAGTVLAESVSRVGQGSVTAAAQVTGTLLGTATVTGTGTVDATGRTPTVTVPVDALGSTLDADTVLAGGVRHLWGLQESSGSTTAGDVSGAPGRPGLTLTQHGAEGTAAFGTTGVLPEGSACLFTPASVGSGLLLEGDFGVYVGGDFTLFAQFAWSGDTGTDLVRIGSIDGTGAQVLLGATPGQVVASLVNQTGTLREVGVTTATREGPHWVALAVGSDAVALYVDDEPVVTTSSPGNMGTIDGLHIGSISSADPVRLAWVGFADHAYDAERIGELALLATGGAERSDERVARVLGWSGVAGDAVLELGASDIAYQTFTDRAGLDVINEANTAELGVFFADGEGRMVQHSRTHRYNDTVGFTVDAEYVTADTSVAVDLTRVVNDYQVSRPAGGTYRARDESSILAYGLHARSATVPAATDDALRDAADAWVARYAHPSPRIPSVSVDLLTGNDPALVRAALAVQIGDLIQVTGLPSTTPGGTSVDLYVEGVDEYLSATGWRVTFATSPARWTAAWVLGSTDYGQLGTTTILAY